jgi:hypothetical protein
LFIARQENFLPGLARSVAPPPFYPAADRSGASFTPGADASVDVVISNGVFHLCPDKPDVLTEAGFVERHLPGGTGYPTSSCTEGALISARKPTFNKQAEEQLWWIPNPRRGTEKKA